MSFRRIGPEDVSTLTIVTNPLRSYASSSTRGTTGSVHVYARRSTVEKDSWPVPSFLDSTHDDVDLSGELQSLQQLGVAARANETVASARFPGAVARYMQAVGRVGPSARKTKALDVVRFTPTTTFTSNTVRKLAVKDQLSTYHRTVYPSAHWAYTNYNCLAFFTSSTVPTSSCLMYPSLPGGPGHDGYVTGTYVPSGAFSIDLYVNPRYRPDRPDGEFRAGTILHLSSTYAVSLVSGASKDENGRPLSYRVLLQLSHSADVPPSSLVPGPPGSGRAYHSGGADLRVGYAAADLAFISNDLALLWNRWHHLVIRWGTSLVNGGTGSFNVDGDDVGTFLVPSSTIAPRTFAAGGNSAPDVLFVGNYFEGLSHGTGSTTLFFAADPAARDGLEPLDGTTGVDEPRGYRFAHPLNADIHDLAIKTYYMSDSDIAASASRGPTYVDPATTAFYVPPFFVEESPFRRSVGTHGGVPQTPFFEIDGTTADPFNVALSFGVAGHLVNVENFVRDFAGNVFPRCHHMTASVLGDTTQFRSADEILNDQPYVRRRNSLLMPCDDGLFVPSFELLASESVRSLAVDDVGVWEPGFIGMQRMICTSSALFGSDFSGDSTFVDEAIGFTPEAPGTSPGRAFLGYADRVARLVASGTFDVGIQDGAPLAVFQRTRDPSSNQVVFFDVSNLYYGRRIMPGTLVLADTALSGTGGAVTITLRDDGRGTLYRADAITSASSWNAVGTVFYDEGIIVVKSPHLYWFGREGFELSFRGEQNVHVMTVDVIAAANQLNSSSNPNFTDVPASLEPNDPCTGFVYVTGINFHDDNYNVVAKVQLAQPVLKRHSERLLLRTRIDF